MPTDPVGKVTVLGGNGFIGSHLVRHLAARHQPYEAPDREADLRGRDLGAVVYCIGVGSDFARRPLDAVEAHVCLLERILRECRFDSFVYLSSTRLYGAYGGTREDETIEIEPSLPDQLYNVSKLMGESLVLSAHPGARVARLSHVYGPNFASSAFLPSVLRDAVSHRQVTFTSSMRSRRDFVSVDDVVDSLLKIARRGVHRIYNVAGGKRVSHAEIAGCLERLTGCRVGVTPDAREGSQPEVGVDRLRTEFDYAPARLLEAMPELVDAYAHHFRGGP